MVERLKCEYCEKDKDDVELRKTPLLTQKINLCKNCFKVSGTQAFFYNFAQAD